jgi:hypothetical protein
MCEIAYDETKTLQDKVKKKKKTKTKTNKQTKF